MRCSGRIVSESRTDLIKDKITKNNLVEASLTRIQGQDPRKKIGFYVFTVQHDLWSVVEKEKDPFSCGLLVITILAF